MDSLQVPDGGSLDQATQSFALRCLEEKEESVVRETPRVTKSAPQGGPRAL